MTQRRSSPVQSTLVGRDVEVERGQDALDQLIDGHGTLLLISGEPGIGKTRLAEELAALAADQGALVSWGHVDDVDGAPPYSPWVQLLEGVLDAADRDVVVDALTPNAEPIAAIVDGVGRFVGAVAPAAPLDPAAARVRLHEAVCDVLLRVGGQRPLVLVLEDLHWADVASLELARFAAARLRTAAVLLIVTYRTVDGGGSAAFDEVLGSFARQPSLQRIALTGLAEAEVGRFMAQTVGLRPRTAAVSAVHARTEGNPFYVRELARLLHSEGSLGAVGSRGRAGVPVGVRDVVRRRLVRLPAATNELLVLAAVIGREFDFEVLAVTADIGDADVIDAVEVATEAALLDEVPGAFGRLRFSHAIIRDTVYGELGALRRATLHARVGAAIERRSAADRRSQLSELAWHFFHAAPVVGPEPGLTHALDAAREAQAAFAYEQAEDGLGRALSLVELMPDGDARIARELDVQHRLASLLLMTKGQGAPEFGRACVRARELSQLAGESDELFKMLFGLSLFHVTNGEYALLTEIGEQMLAVGERRSSTPWLFAAHLSIGGAELHTGALAGARASFAAAEELARTLELSSPVSELLGEHPLALCLPCVGIVHWLRGDAERARASYDEAVALARSVDHPISLADALYARNKLTVFEGDAARALAEADDALKLCDEHAFGMFQAWLRTHRGWALCHHGRCDEGIAEMSAGIAADRAGGGRMNTTFFLALLAEGEALRGDNERALALVEEALALARRGEDRFYEADLHRRRGELLAARGPGHVEEAARSLQTAVSIAAAQGAVPFERQAQAALAVLGLQPSARRADDGAEQGLSPRERELLGLVGRGLTDKEIARDLVISLATVRSHLDRIRDKTGRRRRPELSRLADELGLTGA